jgi:hypothetical protein
MKCPKCKYTTFDYFDTCPRCGKDILGEKAKLHIIAIKPNTPFLLGSLTGDLNDSSAAFVVPESVKKASESMTLNADGIYDDGSELNINMDEEPVVDSLSEAPDISDLSATGDDYELEIDIDSEQMPNEIAGSGGAQPEVSKSEAKGDDKDLGLEIEDLDLKLEMSEEEDSDK